MAALTAPFGLTMRYAMKANPHPDILRLFQTEGLSFDASSSYEASAAIAAGVEAGRILVTSQQMPHNLAELIEQGVQFNATSLHQLEAYGKAFPGTAVSVRLNPGIGSGEFKQVNVGGASSSFGIWHAYVPQILELAERYKLSITRLHTHIGSGTDPKIWRQAAALSLSFVRSFPEVSTVNLGGGYKVARMPDEHATDVGAAVAEIAQEVQRFANETGRQLHLEFEPGKSLVAHAGLLLARIDDIVDTGPEGYAFIKLDTGMTDLMRPALYNAQHSIAVLNGATTSKDYVVVGHCCESTDLLSPAPGKPGTIGTRRLAEAAIGDLVAIGSVGDYAAAMRFAGFNGFPGAAEIFVD